MLSRVLLLVACLLFVISAFAFGDTVIHHQSGYAFLAGGFATWLLAQAVAGMVAPTRKT